MSVVTRKKEKLFSELKKFMEQLYWGDNLHQGEAIRNFEDGLVEIIYPTQQHAANGLLITDDGYFLTPRHCLSDIKSKSIKFQDGNCYPIEKICAYIPKEDIALAKADVPRECRAKEYRYYNTNKLGKMHVTILTRWYRTLDVKGGAIDKFYFVHNVKSDFKKTYFLNNHFTINKLSANIVPGDSGGIVLSPDVRLIGMLSSLCPYDTYVSATKMISALKVVDFYKRKIEKSL